MNSQRVLVTGGTGFIGANLLRALAVTDCDLHVIVRAHSDLWRLQGIESRLHMHIADLLNDAELRGVVAACRPDVIYHLAGHGVMPGQRNRQEILAGNLLATGHLLSALDGHDYRRFVLAGSSAEYGPTEHAVREDDPLHPTSDYGVAKAAASLLCLAEAAKGRPVAVVRIFTAYGPWEVEPRLVPNVMRCCKCNEAPKLTSGWQERDFVHVGDVVDLLQIAARHPAVIGKVLHAATGTTHSIRNAVETIIDIAGATIVPEYGTVARQTNEPLRWSASIDATAALTGWQPHFDLRAGLSRTWDWAVAQPTARATT